MYTLCWSFRNRLETLIESIESADKTCPKEVDFQLVDAASSEETIRQLREFCNTIKDRTVRICEATYRTGLSEAWNLAMMLTKNRYVIITSSDNIFLNSGWFEALKERFERGEEYILIGNHAVFGFDKKAIIKMGWFDEDFNAGPHFDCDFMIKASEAGITVTSIHNASFFVHHSEDSEYFKRRVTEGVENCLPMADTYNEIVFQNKWESGWPGWKSSFDAGRYVDLPHPPVYITQCRRKYPETDPHPIYTKKYNDL
jgi:glycosyltransferase involved in cell wall biosynthesis